MTSGQSNTDKDPYDLQRFLDAQEGVYDRALAELQCGRKRTHWMWYIFPQVSGLGRSSTTVYYAIKSAEEARQYLQHAILGGRLEECAKTLLELEGCTASEVFGYPDTLKLKSSMTLFASIAEGRHTVFAQVLDKYYQGTPDQKTLEILAEYTEQS